VNNNQSTMNAKTNGSYLSL